MTITKKAFITGITGQDGSYLAELLLTKGYKVYGLVRRVALENPRNRLRRIYHLRDKIKIVSGSIESYSRLIEIFDEIKPQECYHLAAQSFVHESFDDCFSTFNINIIGTLHVLAALRKKAPRCKFYFAGSSEMFGRVREVPQNENTPFYPRSPYGVSKVTGFDLTRNYREAYNIFACTGILFNHESPRRGFEFVTRKITSSLANIVKKKDNMVILGNLKARRDWGFAGDYVRAMWLMLQQEMPDDYVVATGESHSIKEFLNIAFEYTNLNYELVDLHSYDIGQADKMVAKLKKDKKKIFVIQHPRFYRPTEVNELVGDYSKAKQVLGWRPRVRFNELVKMMLDYDLKEEI